MVIKKRHPAFVLIMSLITFGIYFLYWSYLTGVELNQSTDYKFPAWLIFLGLIPGIGIIFAIAFYWMHSKAVNRLTGFSNIALFLLWHFLAPVAIVLAQIELNKKA